MQTDTGWRIVRPLTNLQRRCPHVATYTIQIKLGGVLMEQSIRCKECHQVMNKGGDQP